MALVLINVFGENQNMIQVNKLIEETPEDIVDEVLKDSRTITESERHDEVLKVSYVGLEDSFPFVSFSNTDKMMGISQI